MAHRIEYKVYTCTGNYASKWDFDASKGGLDNNLRQLVNDLSLQSKLVTVIHYPIN